MKDSAILLIGYGKIASRIADILAPENRVWALARSERKLAGGVRYIRADVTDPDSFEGRLPEDPEYVIYCLSPGARTEDAYRRTYVDGLANILGALSGTASLKRFILVSSTSVYHQDDGSRVDESSPTEPDSYAGRLILEGEHLLPGSAVPSTVVRFSGIYGAGRSRLVEQIVDGTRGLAERKRITNRIHEDDCVGFLLHLMSRDHEGQAIEACYLASDSCPVDMNEVVRFIAQEHGVVPATEGRVQRRRGGNKYCNNRLMLESGYSLKYPDFRLGYTRSS